MTSQSTESAPTDGDWKASCRRTLEVRSKEIRGERQLHRIGFLRPDGKPRPNLLVFVHGFTGSILSTWGRFPELLAEDPDWEDWDLSFFGYRTGVARRFTHVGTANVVGELARSLELESSTVQSIGLVGHSMGGLLLVDSLRFLESEKTVRASALRDRLRFLLTYGTPFRGDESPWYHPKRWLGYLGFTEVATFYRASGDRQNLIAWLKGRFSRDNIVLSADAGQAFVLFKAVYGSGDRVAAPLDSESFIPQEALYPIDVSHTRLSKPKDNREYSYRVLATARQESARPERLLNGVAAGIAPEALRANGSVVPSAAHNLSLVEGLPGGLDLVFRGLNLTPPKADGDHKYSRIVHRLSIDRDGTCHRSMERHGTRVTDGLTDHIDFGLGGSQPFSLADAQRTWCAYDLNDHKPLPVTIVEPGNAFQKICRVTLRRAVAQSEAFQVQCDMHWPDSAYDKIGCIGVSLEGLSVARLELTIRFAQEPEMVRLYEVVNGAAQLSKEQLSRGIDNDLRLVTMAPPKSWQYFLVWVSSEPVLAS